MTMIKNCKNTRLDIPFCVTTQQAQNICITFVQRRPNVFGVGPTLYKCYRSASVLCLLGSHIICCLTGVSALLQTN